jgi:hypothetical protein
MRKAALIVLLPGLVLQADAFQAKGMGFSFIEPTGLSAKIWLKRGRAVQAAAGWSPHKGNPFQVQADYQFVQFSLFRNPSSDFLLFAGAGVRLRFQSDIHAALRFPVGFDFQSKAVPLNLFLEFTPLIALNPDVGIDLKAALGFRYLFH